MYLTFCYIYLIFNSDIYLCIIFLLQGWILEHLSGPYPRKKNKSWKPERSCAGKWLTTRGHTTMHHYRSRLDRLEVDDVRWSAYDDHREMRPFNLLSLTRDGWCAGRRWCTVIYLSGLRGSLALCRTSPNIRQMSLRCLRRCWLLWW